MEQQGYVDSSRPQRYLHRLVRHFAHKVPARFEDAEGEIHFPFGDCFLRIDGERLILRCQADSGEDLSNLKDVIERHLVRFGGDETPTLVWVPR